MSLQRDLPPEVEEKIATMQNLQNQLQSLRIQLEANQRELTEIKSTLKEIENHEEEEELYKSVGSIFFKTTAKKARDEFNDRLEVLERRNTRLKEQDSRSKNQLEELNKEVSMQIGRTSK